MTGDGSTVAAESVRRAAEMRSASAAAPVMGHCRTGTVQAQAPGADDRPMITLVCKACGGVLRFGERGWEHRDPIRPCARAMVAWPPPGDGDEEDELLAETG